MKAKNVFINLFLAIFLGGSIMNGTGSKAAGLLVAGLVFLSGFLMPAKASETSHFAKMGLQVELWQGTIEKNLYKDNEFITHSKSGDEYVQGGKYVHIPQQGSAAEVIKNPTLFPLPVGEQEDSDVIYQLDYFVTKPKRISWNSTQEISYDFRSSTIENDMLKLKESMAESVLDNWVGAPAVGSYAASGLPSASILAVTGTNGTGNVEAEGATGNRKQFSINDLQRAQNFFRSQNMWREGQMYALLTPLALMEIAPADSVVTATYMQSVTEAERRAGVYMKIQGFKIMSRSSVYRTEADGTLRVSGEAGEATDNSASLFWTPQAVEHAKGEIKFMADEDNPVWGGSVYNWSVRMGGRARRADYKGICLLRQTATA